MHKFLLQMNLAHGKFELRGVDVVGDKTGAILPVQYEVKDPGAVVEPFLRVEPEALQQLADQLWEAGIKPLAAQREIAVAMHTAGGQTAPWLMRQLEKFIDQVTKKEPPHVQG